MNHPKSQTCCSLWHLLEREGLFGGLGGFLTPAALISLLFLFSFRGRELSPGQVCRGCGVRAPQRVPAGAGLGGGCAVWPRPFCSESALGGRRKRNKVPVQ